MKLGAMLHFMLLPCLLIRLITLNKIAIRQMSVLQDVENRKLLR
jgi:hypothetical protein